MNEPDAAASLRDEDIPDIPKWEDIGAEDQEVATEPAGEAGPEVGTEPEDALTEPQVAFSPAEAGTDPEQEPEGSAQQQAEAHPEAEGATEPAEGAPKEGSPTPETEAPHSEPFALRVDGREYEVPGAVVTDGYVAIPVESFQRVIQPRLADRTAWIEERRAMQDKLEAKSVQEVQAAEVLKAMDELLESGADEMLQWFQNFDANKAALKSRVETASLRAQIDQRSKADEQRSEQEQVERYWIDRDQMLSPWVRSALSQPGIKEAGLDENEIIAQFLELGHEPFFEAQEDNPEFGWQRGGIYANPEFVFRHIQQLVQLATKIRAEARQTAEAKAKNQRTRRTKAPPTVPAKGSPPLAGERTAPTNVEEWEQSLQEVVKSFD